MDTKFWIATAAAAILGATAIAQQISGPKATATVQAHNKAYWVQVKVLANPQVGDTFPAYALAFESPSNKPVDGVFSWTVGDTAVFSILRLTSDTSALLVAKKVGVGIDVTATLTGIK